jgi:hypothetical protein
LIGGVPSRDGNNRIAFIVLVGRKPNESIDRRIILN